MTQEFIEVTSTAHVVSVGSPGTVRKTINLPSNLVRELENTMEEQGISFSEAVRRSIDLDNYVRKVLRNNGNILIRESSDGPYGKLEIEES